MVYEVLMTPVTIGVLTGPYILMKHISISYFIK